VAARVVDVPVKQPGAETLLLEERGDRPPIEREQIGVLRRKLHRDRERLSTVAAAKRAVVRDQIVKARVFVEVGALRSDHRQEAFLPAPVQEQALLRREAEVFFLVDGIAMLAVALDHAELREELADGARFLRWERHVMRAPRIARYRAFAE